SERSQRRIPCSHSKRVARQSSRLVDRSGGRDLLHDFPPSPVCRGGKPSTDDFAEGRHIGGDSEHFARTRRSDAKACHYLIKDEQRTGVVSDLSQSVEKSFFRRNESRIPDDRLDNYRSETSFTAR